ncbi:acetyl-CoA acetyltransferase [Candidatus Phycosocius spiralis]|uniref:Acetyl-CoA acetyltransferase n=1 Tax=Candidatus Phycosocius spiralis TaxID=2815099 RepID=A0ABQ4PYB2_9PROT|nr:acetyl-CoA acetyltransferase [Candidatus Phycosocius spiralis]GIU68070.1 acetyl-CoA acetyltransferase [Candidatus Phycosocius spiralis]
MIDAHTPVLIGGGQFTYRGAPELCPTPIEFCALAAKAAAVDSGLPQSVLTGIDGLAVVGFTIDAGTSMASLPIPKANNPPKTLAKALGATPAWKVYTHVGGNNPQALVNAAASRIARGENKLVLLTGAECLNSMMKLVRAGHFHALAGHQQDEAEAPQMFGEGFEGSSAHEAHHGLAFPANVYPLFENAYRSYVGRDLASHQTALGALYAPFTQVAAHNPFAWFRHSHSAKDLITIGPTNRMVGYPYPKFLNAILQVDQSASVLMASYAHAMALGIGKEAMVFLHGCADTVEKWNILDRVDYHSSPAMTLALKEALSMAGKSPGDIGFFDLYSCFPIAVELACEALGMAGDDPRGLTLTGGLPYFGGPGNNYSMHGLVEMIHRCRKEPSAFGLLNANGWYLTKHAVGIYSCAPTQGPWVRRDPHAYQVQIDHLVSPPIITQPSGPATIETYTVIHSRDGYRMGIVIGRDEAGSRFVANTPNDDQAIMADLEAQEGIGRTGFVTHEGGRNIFKPASHV